MKILNNIMFVLAATLMVSGAAIAGVDASATSFTLPLDGLEGFMIAGMIVNKEAIKSFFVGIKTIFNNALNAAPEEWRDTAMEMPSTTATEDYKWLSRFPAMRKWVGEKVIKNIAAVNYKVTNDDFEATIEVNRNDIDDETTGSYAIQARMNAQSAAELPGDVIDELKNGGFTSLCMDGQYFYDTDHPVGDNGSFSNKGTAVLSFATPAACDASYGAARISMMALEDTEGKKLKVMPSILEVPPQLETVAKNIVNAEKFADGTPNPYRNSATVKVNAALTSTTSWFLHCTTKPVMPFIYQKRKAPTVVQSNEDEFMKGKLYIGLEARGAGVYTFPQLSYGSDGTV